MTKRAREAEAKLYFEWEWRDLAVYNAEVARGIKHTAVYDRWATREQKRFDEKAVKDARRKLQALA